MPRIIDLIVVLVVAVVLLIPKASITAQPAIVGDPIEVDGLSELADRHAKSPDDVDAALALADGLLSYFRADWALATLARYGDSRDHRVHLLRATAHAERLESPEAVAEATRAEQLCADEARATPPCRPGTLARVGLIRQSMQVLVDGNLDPAKDPVRARDAVAKVLRSSRYGLPLSRPSPSPASPPATNPTPGK